MTDKEREYYKNYYIRKLKEKGQAPLSDKIAIRREKVLTLKKQGISHAKIAKQLHVTIRTVTNDVRFLKETGKI